MSDYDNTNRGSIWGNEDKQKPDANPKWPDYKGTINIEGQEYWLSGWKRRPDAKPKSPAMTFTVKKKEPRQGKDYPEDKPETAPMNDGFDDIPF